MDYGQNSTKYVYVITRTDLSAPQISVQSCHAAIEASLAFGDSQAEHPHICLCGVKNEASLISGANYLDSHGISFCAWYEPDRNNELTALATEPLSGDRRSSLRKFQCLKEAQKQGV